MTELWVLCEHGKKDTHFLSWATAKRGIRLANWCPGGRLATVEEVVEWLVERGEWPHGIAPMPVGKAQDV